MSCRSAPSSRAHSVDGSTQFGPASRYALGPRCGSPGTPVASYPAALGPAAAGPTDAAAFFGSTGQLSMLPLAAAAAAAASGRPLVRMQQSRSSSQLSLEGLPCGVVSPAGSSGGCVSSNGLRHCASYGNLQVGLHMPVWS